MKKLMLLLALAAMPMVAFAETPASPTPKKTTHKKHKKTASPNPEASPAASASPAAKSSSTTKKPAAKASPSPEAK